MIHQQELNEWILNIFYTSRDSIPQFIKNMVNSNSYSLLIYPEKTVFFTHTRLCNTESSTYCEYTSYVTHQPRISTTDVYCAVTMGSWKLLQRVHVLQGSTSHLYSDTHMPESNHHITHAVIGVIADPTRRLRRVGSAFNNNTLEHIAAPWIR